VWQVGRLEPGDCSRHLPFVLHLSGRLDRTSLRDACTLVLVRHDQLRACILAGEDAVGQWIRPYGDGFVDEVLFEADLSSQPPVDPWTFAQQVAREPFDLARGPLIRMVLARSGEHRHHLIVVVHQVTSDEASTMILMAEIAEAYNALVEGREPALSTPATTFATHVVRERALLSSDTVRRHADFWRDTMPSAIAPVLLPWDHPSAPADVAEARARLTVDEGLWRGAIGCAARVRPGSMSVFLVSVLQAQLRRYGNDGRLCITTAMSTRRPETSGVVGLFANRVPVITEVSGDPTFIELMADVRRSFRAVLPHRGHPVARTVAGPPFEVLLSLVRCPQLRMRDLETRLERVHVGARSDLLLEVLDHGSYADLVLEGPQERFDRATMERTLGHFHSLLRAAVADPERRLSELALLTEAERHQLLLEWNDTAAELPAGGTVHALVEEQCARTPEAIAVVCGERALRYAQLEAQANQLAHHLTDLGVGPEVLVALCVERGVEMVVGELGILKAGGAYLPLDPGHPAERLAFMLEDSGAPVLLTQSALLPRLPDHHGARVVCLDSDWPAIASRPETRPEPGAHAGNLAYVIYTSGSTGQPKGVMVEHRGVTNLVLWHRRTYAVGPEDRATQLAAVGFDATVWELWPYLASGASIRVPDRELRESPERLWSWLGAQGITLSFLPTPLAESILAAGWPPGPRLRTLLTGGDRLRRCPAVAQGLELINHYGPTECTVVATSARVPAAPDGDEVSSPPIGRPIDNTHVYVVDEHLQPRPVGVPGELCIGGVGVARGYLRRPELTAERFLRDPFSPDPGARLYRTGDLARWRPDGTLDFLGRLDHQVKIRGHRIECGEVEAALLAHPRVRQAVVTACDDGGGQQRLVAHLVATGARPPTTTELRAHLSRSLPEYMVPAAFVGLDALPLTANGKLDRATLPAPEGRPELEVGYVAPRTPTEEVVAGIWAELLGLQRVGVHDDLFDLGGHSLLATRLVSRIRATLAVELPLRAVFEAPTVAGLARTVEASRLGGLAPAAPLAPASREGPLPLSFAQERLWFLQQLEPGSARYTIPLGLRLAGPLDVAGLERALHDLVARHEALRTTFPAVDGRPAQVISAPEPVRLEVSDLRGLPPAGREPEARRRAREAARRPFDLARGPLLRAQLMRLDGEDHVLLLVLHHIAADGWSLGLLTAELGAAYTAHLRGQPVTLPDAPIQYADFAVWQRRWLSGEALDAQLEYWRRQLAGSPPVLELPADHPRTAEPGDHGGVEEFTISAESAARLTALARAHGSTLFMTLLAAFQTLLSRHTGSSDIVVGTPVAGRTRSETEQVVGLFLNTLVLRTSLSGDPTFAELLSRARETVLAASAHQDVPFERLVAELQPGRDLGRAPLFQVMLSMNNFPQQDLRLPGVAVSRFPIDSGAAKFDLTLSFTETPDGLRGELEYDRDLFEEATIARLPGHLQTLLAQVAAHPEARLSELSMLTEAESRLLVEWNATAAGLPVAPTLHALVEEQVALAPGAVAVADDHQELTYAQLDVRANQLAHHLRSLGAGSGTLVGVCLERGVDLVVALLGILKAGAAYLPLDPDFPARRLALMLDDCQAPLLLTQSTLLGRLPDGRGAQVLLLDGEAAAIDTHPETPPDVRCDGGDLAYVIHTSGSTGTPKGVMVEHRSVVNLLASMRRQPGIGAGDILLAVTTLSFDIAALELFLPLAGGARVVVAGPGVAADGARLADRIAETGATVVQATPVTWRMLLDAGWQGDPGLRILCGGEALDRALADRLLARGAALWNLYGPTETTIWSALHRVEPGDGPVPIGRPIANTRIHLLDEHRSPVPVGVPGELYIGGAGVARGYLRRPELTAERFLTDPFAPEPGARMYRTGDLARRRPDGTLECLGRIDHQVKIRGHRIECGEVEAALLAHPGVREAVVVARDAGAGERRLVAYLVAAAGRPPTTTELRAHLRRSLPGYMVPDAFVGLDALPHTPNGKLDRAALPAPEGRPDLDAAYAAPRTPTEGVLAALWAELLGIDRVGAHDNFFDLGGHSLLATRLIAAMERRFGVRLPLALLF
jgi:amino acid adenylation domain-containing protein